METEKNVFEKMKAGNSAKEEKPSQQPMAQPGEINVADFSDTAVGDRQIYERPDLDGKEDIIDKFQVFNPDIMQDPDESQAGTSKYWRVTAILCYDSKNEDGVQNREYISGARCFVQQDGRSSPVSFWYSGCETQMGALWEQVAKKLGKEPEDMSPREFVVFLNNKPKVKIQAKEFKNFGAKPGMPKTIKKNLIGEFL